MTAQRAGSGLKRDCRVIAQVAQIVVDSIEEERFLILSHETVREYEMRKVTNRDRWLAGMRRLRNKIYGTPSG